jgi:hypothetical protein
MKNFLKPLLRTTIVNRMNIAIISHERSLNKTETIIRNLHTSHRLFLVVEGKYSKYKEAYASKCHQVIEAPDFDIELIKSKLPSCDKVFCVSENLIPIQNQLEKHFNIMNITSLASEVLSNKYELHKFCMSQQLNEFCPKTIIPYSEEMLSSFEGKIIVKPDIGTGSNRFLPQEFCDLEYKVWDSTAHLIDFLNSKKLKESFFKINKDSIKIKRFNNKPCKIMVQSFISNDSPVYAPCGFFKDGSARIAFFAKITPTLITLENGMTEAGNIEIYSAHPSQVPKEILGCSTYFIETLLSKLGVREMFFAGPDFYPSKGAYYAVDFNPRPGHFFNLIDKLNNGSIFQSVWSGRTNQSINKLLWKVVNVKNDRVEDLNWIEKYRSYIPAASRNIKVGDKLPKSPTLQSKPRSIQLMITGDSELEIYSKFERIEDKIQLEFNK